MSKQDFQFKKENNGSRIVDTHYVIYPDGSIYSDYSKRFLSGYKNKDGYTVVSINIKGKRFICLLHRLVAMAFIRKVKGKDFVNHLDGNKPNNAVSNLEWCTKKENSIHAYRNNLVSTEKAVNKNKKKVICEETSDIFNSAADAARSMGYNSLAVVVAIRRNRKCGGYTWKYIKGENNA